MDGDRMDFKRRLGGDGGCWVLSGHKRKVSHGRRRARQKTLALKIAS